MSSAHSPTFNVASPTSQLILQPFRHFTYVTAHSQTLPSLYLRHSSFSKTSVGSPKSQFIFQPFFRFSYVTSCSLNSPGEPPMSCQEGFSEILYLQRRDNARWASFEHFTYLIQTHGVIWTHATVVLCVYCHEAHDECCCGHQPDHGDSCGTTTAHNSEFT